MRVLVFNRRSCLGAAATLLLCLRVSAAPDVGIRDSMERSERTSPPPEQVPLAREPYQQQVTSTSGVVVWATAAPGKAQVRLTSPDGTARMIAATSTHFPATATGMAADYYQHVARLTSLVPATTYTYDILVDDVDLNSAIDTLRTAPAPGTGTVTFVAFGDSGTGSLQQQQVAARLAEDSFDLALHGGDIAYANSSGTGAASYQTMNDWFFRMYRAWLRNRPLFPSMGNHDSRTANADGRPYLGLFELPTHAATSTYPDHAERYYSFDYGPIHVIVLDTEFAFQDANRRAAQLAWADADLAATTQPWKVALYHRSAYSAGGENGSELPVREAFAPLFDRHGVHLALSAHEHDYERTFPLRGNVADPAGTVYVVSGGGGAPLYPSAYGAWTAYSASVNHYVRGNATACTLRLDAVGVDGVVFDSVTLTGCEEPRDTDAPMVAITSPPSGGAVHGQVTVAVDARDNVAVTSVELRVDGVPVAQDTAAPFNLSWNSTTVGDGAHVLTARATDGAGNTAASADVTVTVNNAALGDGDILLYGADADVLRGRWVKEADATAAGGLKLRYPDAGDAKRATPLAEPVDYAELTFTAVPGVPYRFWMRARADRNHYQNDSVFVQFTGANDFAIGTTRATEYNLEHCSGCGLAAWGWQDNAWGIGAESTPITFTAAGPHTIRIQPREDGLSIDQILLSPVKFFSTAPGAMQNDTSIYPRPADPQPATAWTSQDIGAVGVAGSTSESGGLVTLRGSGADVWGTADAFHYAWQRVTGDVDVIARVASVENVHAWTKAGVMIRAGLSADAAHGFMIVSPGKGLAFQRRVKTGGLSTHTSGGAGTAPRWVKLARRGTTLSAYHSADGANWTFVGSDTFAMSEEIYVGLALNGHDDTRLASAVFENVSVRPPATATTPSGWTPQDVGLVGLAGSTSENGGQITLRASGADVWGTADAFHYSWQRVSGNADIVARVVSVENVHAWTKAGVMVRGGLSASAAHGFMIVSPGKGLAFQRRVATGGISTHTSGGAGVAPAWVKLERRGTTITAYSSTNGLTWNLVGSDTFSVGEEVYVGLALNGHDNTRLATAVFENVSITPR